jgi:hypothetical protein
VLLSERACKKQNPSSSDHFEFRSLHLHNTQTENIHIDGNSDEEEEEEEEEEEQEDGTPLPPPVLSKTAAGKRKERRQTKYYVRLDDEDGIMLCDIDIPEQLVHTAVDPAELITQVNNSPYSWFEAIKRCVQAELAALSRIQELEEHYERALNLNQAQLLKTEEALTNLTTERILKIQALKDVGRLRGIRDEHRKILKNQ